MICRRDCKNWKHELKSLGLIDRKQVQLLRNKQLDQLLNQSLGKLNAVEIFSGRIRNIRQRVRQLVLTDFIRKIFEVHLGSEVQYSQLGVLPYFEVLRKFIGQLTCLWRFLTGNLVIIPTAVKPRLEFIFGPDKCDSNR